MFRPAEGFAPTETLVPHHGFGAPSESTVPFQGGFAQREFFQPYPGGFSPADTHAKFLDDIRGSQHCRHPRDYVEELMMPDPVMLHHLAHLVAQYLHLIKQSTARNSNDTNCFSNVTAPSRSDSSPGSKNSSGDVQTLRTSQQTGHNRNRTPEEAQSEAESSGDSRQRERQRPGDVSSETGKPSDKSVQLSNAGKKTATAMNSVGKCATGVQRALASIGMPEFTGKFHGWQAKEVLLNSGKFEQVPLSQIREGDIVCRKANQNLRDQYAKYGHVAIIGKGQNGNLMEYSDHAKAFNAKHPRYTETVALRLKPQYA